MRWQALLPGCRICSSYLVVACMCASVGDDQVRLANCVGNLMQLTCGISDTEPYTINMCRAARRGKQIKDLAWFFIASCVFLFFIAAGAQRVPALDSGQWLPPSALRPYGAGVLQSRNCMQMLETVAHRMTAASEEGLDGLSLPVLSSPWR